MPSASSPNVPNILREAQWIWPDNLGWDLSNCYALFRKTFSLKSLPNTAPFYLTADQSYQMYLNGRYVCRGPARGFQKTWPYDEVNIRPWLKKGRNVLAIRAYNPGRSNFQYIHQGYAGLLAGGEFGSCRIVTDQTWKCRRQNGINRATTPTSLQLFPQEDIDLREEDPGWMLPGFKEDEAWTPREIGACVWNGMPWDGLEERGIPMLDESLMRPSLSLGKSNGCSNPNWRKARNLAINRAEEGLAHKAESGSAETLEFAPSRPGYWRSYLIDFGKVVVGSVILHIENALGGESVETLHAESVDSETLAPHFAIHDHCRTAFAHRLTCRPGKQEHQFYHAFGFRYMVLTVRDNRKSLRVSTSLRFALYPHELKGVFRSSKGNLERVWSACAWTERICSLDAYVDTPWREQAQWWGDARVQAWNTFHLSGDHRLFCRGIRQIGTQTTPSGITYGHAPTMAHSCILPDFTLIWMATLWDDYWQTGSLDLFLSQQRTIESAFAYFEEWTDAKSGLLRHDHRYWLFLDWSDLQKEGCPSVYSFWLLYALDRFTTLYKLTGNRKAARHCQLWASRLRLALLSLQRPDGLIGDGILPDGKINRHCSVHSQTLALMNRLSPEQEQTLVHRSLLPLVQGKSKTSVVPSAYWITYVYTELAIRGYGREVLADIQTKWADMAEFGSTFEGFDGLPGEGSRSHAWAAHPLFHLMQILGGIRQTAPAWKEISFSPLFLGDHAEVTIPAPKGNISSIWKRTEAGLVTGTLHLPTGVKASVSLPGKTKYTVNGPSLNKFTATPEV